MPEESSSLGRRLFGAPILLQDWDCEAEEGAAQYWELFLDLLLVAAASSLTDEFKDNLTVYGLGEFAVFYLILINSWLLYSHHITTRFEDSSLAHSMVLFVYCVGFGVAIVNTGYRHVQYFCLGSLIQRLSILCMLWNLTCIERARYFSFVLGALTVVTMSALCFVAMWGDEIEHSTPISIIFWVAALLESLGEIFMALLIDNQSLIPINIEKTKERLGAMELIMLGETVLSVCVIYKKMMSNGEISGMEGLQEQDPSIVYERDVNFENDTIAEGKSQQQPYYWALLFSFLLVFMFLLFYFHMQPAPADHAFRRSRFHGTAYLLLHKVLGLAFLAVGTSIKLVVEAVLSTEPMPAFASKLMGYGVGSALIILFIMRYLHYGGKDGINFGNRVLNYGQDASLDKIASYWWWTVGIAALLPCVGVFTGMTLQLEPLPLTGVHAALLFVLCAFESYYSHLLQDGALCQEEHSGENSLSNEKAQLVTASSTKEVSYT